MTKSRLYLALLTVALAISTLDITANLYSYANGVMHLNGIECGPRSDAWATLGFDLSFSPNAINEPFLENIRDVKRQDEYKMAEVRLIGRIEDLERQCRSGDL